MEALQAEARAEAAEEKAAAALARAEAAESRARAELEATAEVRAKLVWRVTLPVFIVVLLALSFEGIRGRELQDEYNAVFTSLLTMTAFSYSVQSSLPKLPYVRSRNTVPSRRRCEASTAPRQVHDAG